MRQHFDESHGKHHAGNKGQCKEKSGTSRQAARTDVVALGVADHTELAEKMTMAKIKAIYAPMPTFFSSFN